MKLIVVIFLSVFSLTTFAQNAGGQTSGTLKLPAIFGDHMVLQQGQDVPVWGKGKPGETVKVTLGKQTAETKVGADGKWLVRLKPVPESREAMEMKVASGGEEKVFKDVLIGDVWLCSGQSNMAMGVGALKGAKKVVAEANHPQLRLFLVHRQVAYEKAEDLEGEWGVCTPKSILMSGGWKGFSAVGYFFGKALLESGKSPIGLVGSYVGGSNIQAWSSLEGLEQFKDSQSMTAKRVVMFKKAKATLTKDCEKYEKELLPAWTKELQEKRAALGKALAEWKDAKKAAKEQGKPAPKRPVMEKLSRHPMNPRGNFSLATVLFNGMINPLIPYGIKGAIWYQGEANAYPGQAENYKKLLPMMITDWRTRWGQGNFPFLFVQLPNLKSKKDTWPIVRESQRRALVTPNTGMAVTIDVGDPNDLHPPIKKPIGDRLAQAARQLVYGEDIVGQSPMVKSAKLKDGKVVLSFDNIGGGLMIGKINENFQVTQTEGKLLYFEITGRDSKFKPAAADIVGKSIVLTCEDVKEPVAVRYAWLPCPEPMVNLYNKEGLPASPFLIKVGEMK